GIISNGAGKEVRPALGPGHARIQVVSEAVGAAYGVVSRKFGGQHVGIFVDQHRVIIFIGVGIPVAKNKGRAAGEVEERRADKPFLVASGLVLVTLTPENDKREWLELRIGGVNEIIGPLYLLKDIECTGLPGLVDQCHPWRPVPHI